MDVEVFMIGGTVGISIRRSDWEEERIRRCIDNWRGGREVTGIEVERVTGIRGSGGNRVIITGKV